MCQMVPSLPSRQYQLPYVALLVLCSSVSMRVLLLPSLPPDAFDILSSFIDLDYYSILPMEPPDIVSCVIQSMLNKHYIIR